jgi:hypothetical protein
VPSKKRRDTAANECMIHRIFRGNREELRAVRGSISELVETRPLDEWDPSKRDQLHKQIFKVKLPEDAPKADPAVVRNAVELLEIIP